MKKTDYEIKMAQLLNEHTEKQKKLMVEFCNANNPYKVGDIFTDHIGSIIIEKIKYSFSYSSIPCCTYFGLELKKDGTPKNNESKRTAWQLNDINTLK